MTLTASVLVGWLLIGLVAGFPRDELRDDLTIQVTKVKAPHKQSWHAADWAHRADFDGMSEDGISSVSAVSWARSWAR